MTSRTIPAFLGVLMAALVGTWAWARAPLPSLQTSSPPPPVLTTLPPARTPAPTASAYPSVPAFTTPNATPTPAPGTTPCPNPLTNILCDGGNPATIETPPTLTTLTPAVDQYGWLVTAPYPPVPGMPELTALQALQTNPPLAPSALITVTTAPANGLWTASQCNWAEDTLFADWELDHHSMVGYALGFNLGQAMYYDYYSADWGMAIKDAQSECWHDTAADPSYAENDINSFRAAEATHAPRVQQYGPSDTWDTSWDDAYQELIVLYQRFDPNHVGCATCL